MDDLTGADSPDRLVKITVLGEAEPEVGLLIKSGLGDVGLAQEIPCWVYCLFFNSGQRAGPGDRVVGRTRDRESTELVFISGSAPCPCHCTVPPTPHFSSLFTKTGPSSSLTKSTQQGVWCASFCVKEGENADRHTHTFVLLYSQDIP